MSAPATVDRARNAHRRRRPAARRRRRGDRASSCSRAAPTRAASRSGSRPPRPSSPARRSSPLKKPGSYRGTTAGGPALITNYRYPTGGDVAYPGPERAYRVSITGRPANFGVVVTVRPRDPHVTFDGAEDHLAGYTGLPIDLNPYRESYGDGRARRRRRAARRRATTTSSSTRAAPRDAGPFTFRYWVNDTTPPTLRVVSTRRARSPSRRRTPARASTRRRSPRPSTARRCR